MLTMLLLAVALTPPPGQGSFLVEARVYTTPANDSVRVVEAGNFPTLEEAVERAGQVADQGVCELRPEAETFAAACWPAHRVKVVVVRRIY